MIQMISIIGLLISLMANADPVDLTVVTKIRDEGFNRSQVMQTLSHLSDNIGPRLTGSPGLLQANNWTKEQMAQWGLENARLEGFEFGRGWTMERVEVFMTSPRRTQLYALPIAWLPGTDGELEGGAIYAPIKEKTDFQKYKGKLKGKIIFIDKVPDEKEPLTRIFRRHDRESLEEIGLFDIPTEDMSKKNEEQWFNWISFLPELDKFLVAEGAKAIVRRPRHDGMKVTASNYQYLISDKANLPGISLAAEHYDRAVRLMKKDREVALSLDVEVTFHEKNTQSYSTLADIPGKGSRPEVVMAGAHLDSWFAGDGAVDNAAGVAVVMEAVRILKAIGIKPKRTIRVGLWGGEEQGRYGSLQYVINHLAERPLSKNENLKYMAASGGQLFGGFPIDTKSEFERFSVYFNIDGGSGKMRGISAEENSAAAEIFRHWLEPFHDLEADTVVQNRYLGTDHESFDRVGLPGFNFIQDPLDYRSRLHHTQLDLLNHVYEKDLKQASVILASFLYNAAMREERIPRKPLPQGPDQY